MGENFVPSGGLNIESVCFRPWSVENGGQKINKNCSLIITVNCRKRLIETQPPREKKKQIRSIYIIITHTVPKKKLSPRQTLTAAHVISLSLSSGQTLTTTKMADTTTIEAAANGAPAKETPPVKQQVECSTLEQFLDKFVKDELCDLDLEDLKEEDKISPEEFLKGQTDVRIVDGKLKDGVLTTADWDLLASRVPECNALEFCNCGLTKIEAPSENNPLKKTINVVVIGDNEGLTSLDFVKHFAEINTFCVDQVPLLKTKEDIEVGFWEFWCSSIQKDRGRLRRTHLRKQYFARTVARHVDVFPPHNFFPSTLPPHSFLLPPKNKLISQRFRLSVSPSLSPPFPLPTQYLISTLFKHIY